MFYFIAGWLQIILTFYTILQKLKEKIMNVFTKEITISGGKYANLIWKLYNVYVPKHHIILYEYV